MVSFICVSSMRHRYEAHINHLIRRWAFLSLTTRYSDERFKFWLAIFRVSQKLKARSFKSNLLQLSFTQLSKAETTVSGRCSVRILRYGKVNGMGTHHESDQLTIHCLRAVPCERSCSDQEYTF